MSSSRDDFGIAIRSALLQKGAKQKFSLRPTFLEQNLVRSEERHDFNNYS